MTSVNPPLLGSPALGLWALRFLVAGALGMQVMTLVVALYAGAFSGMEEPFRKFFRWTSLLLTAPVLLYSARPFFAGAWKDLTHARVRMDVPVALGLTLAYFGSVWATIADRGEVYTVKPVLLQAVA